MIRPIKWIRELLFHNLAWKLLALVVAVAIWALVATEPELTTMATVRLEYKNLPEGMEISSEPSANSVLLELSGPSGALRGVGDTFHPAVVIDMVGATAGERSFSIGDRNVKLMRGVHLLRAIPPVVRYHFEARRFSAAPVHVRFLNEGQNGYTVAEYRVQPAELAIAGPRSRVAKITAVMADTLDVGNTTGTAQLHANAFVDDPFVRFLSPPEVVVTVTMKKK